MILKKTWNTNWNNTNFVYRYTWTGYFLFGFIPLYISRKDNWNV